MIKELNVVNCGSCGEVFGHKTGVEVLTCPYCKMTDDISSFPDYFAPELESSIISLTPLTDALDVYLDIYNNKSTTNN